jgi:hypothetical protein
MFEFERRWLVSILEDLVPGAAEVPIRRFADDLLAHAPGEFLLGLRLCTWVLMLCPPLVLGRLATYRGLSLGERLSVHARLRESRLYVLRELPLLFKMVGCLGYCGLPEVQAKLGITPRDREPPEWAGGEP